MNIERAEANQIIASAQFFRKVINFAKMLLSSPISMDRLSGDYSNQYKTFYKSFIFADGCILHLEVQLLFKGV